MYLFVFITLISSNDKYKKCKDMRFCYQNIDRFGEWSLINPAFDNEKNEFTANLLNHNEDDNLKLIIYLMQSNSFRIQLLLTNQENFTRYKLSENPFVLNQDIVNQHIPLQYNSTTNNAFLISNDCQAEINYSPFYIKISDKYNSMVYINYNQNLIFEHKGEKVPNMNDTNKNGATETGLDFSFKGKKTRISGFSEIDNSFNLNDTLFEPKRLTNINSFSENGHVPLFYGHSSSEMVSLFWMNPTDTFVKISTDNDKDLRNVRLVSEGGYVDFVVFTGQLFDLLKSFTDLTGHHEIPPIFSLGFHLSKSGYSSQDEVEKIINEIDGRDFPLDSIWLDENHLHQKQPFRFNLTAFPNPNLLFQRLSGRNRFLLRMNGPYVPDDETHFQYKYAKENGYFVNESDCVTPFKGNCLSGSCYWPDFLNPEVHKWWSSLYKYKVNESASNVYFLEELNEPTVFSSVDETFPKENIYFGGIEEREIRNLYGLLMSSSSYNGVVNRNDDKNVRPFVVSRSFFAGSQKYSMNLIKGENDFEFDLQRYLISMSVVSGLCGNPLTGFDMNGIESSHLIPQFYEAGVFCNFLLNGNDDFLLNNLTFDFMLNLTKSRYEISPFLYTSIRVSYETGIPPVLPLFALFPEEENLHDVNDQFILGQSLMVALNEKFVKIIKPPGLWYDLKDSSFFNSDSFYEKKSSLSLFLKGGSIVPLFKNVSFSMEETKKNPLKLIVGCDENGNAKGPLYMDDGISFNYEKGEFLNRWLIFENGQIRIEAREPFEKKSTSIVDTLYIDEILFYGLKNMPDKIGSNSTLVCNEKSYICTLYNVGLYLKKIDKEDEDNLDKKTLIIIVVCCTFVGFASVAVAIACIYFCHIDPKKKEAIYEETKIDSILLVE